MGPVDGHSRPLGQGFHHQRHLLDGHQPGAGDDAENALRKPGRALPAFHRMAAGANGQNVHPLFVHLAAQVFHHLLSGYPADGIQPVGLSGDEVLHQVGVHGVALRVDVVGMSPGHEAKPRMLPLGQGRGVSVVAHPEGVERGLRSHAAAQQLFRPVVHLEPPHPKQVQLEKVFQRQLTILAQPVGFLPQFPAEGRIQPRPQLIQPGSCQRKLHAVPVQTAEAGMTDHKRPLKMTGEPLDLLHQEGIDLAAGQNGAVIQIDEVSFHGISSLSNTGLNCRSQPRCSRA